jgi:hypothetical protein
MKFNIKENSITFDKLKKDLEEKFGNKYQVNIRQKGILTVVKGKTCATMLVPTKNKLIVKGGFATMGGQISLNLLVIGLGVLVPALVYYFTFHKKIKVLENQVINFVRIKYNEEIIN